MKLNTLLISGFLIVVLLIGVVGTLALINAKNIEINFDKVKEGTIPAVVALGNIESNLFFLLLEVNEYILSPTEEHLGEFEEAKEDIKKAIVTYEKAEGEAEEMEVEVLKEGTKKIITLGEEIIKLKDDGASQEVLLEKSKELDDLAEEFAHELEKEIERDAKDLEESIISVRSDIQAFTSPIFILLLVAMILAIGISLFISRSISKPIKKLTDSVDEVSKGNFDVEIKKTGNIEEVNSLTDSLNRIMKTMKLAVLEKGPIKIVKPKEKPNEFFGLKKPPTILGIRKLKDKEESDFFGRKKPKKGG